MLDGAPLPRPTLLPKVPALLVPAATLDVGGLDLAVVEAARPVLLVAARATLALGRVGAVPVVLIVRDELVELELVLPRLAVLVLLRKATAAGPAAAGREAEAFLVDEGMNPPEGFLDVLSGSDDPDACRFATGRAGDEGTLRLLALMLVDRGMADREAGSGRRDATGCIVSSESDIPTDCSPQLDRGSPT